MSFVDDILKYNSCSIVGMAKNCGKTVVLNHILSYLQQKSICVGVTSIGLDGERVDAVTQTAKPEILLEKGTYFATSESHYKQRHIHSQIVASTRYPSPLGTILIGEVLEKGKIIISGPSDMYSTRSLINDFHRLGVGLVLVDGALSRKTSASPVVTDSMVLCTGAALSLNIDELVRQTEYTYRLISLETVDEALLAKLHNVEQGVWGITREGEIRKCADTLFDIKEKCQEIAADFPRLYFTGILTSGVLEIIMDSCKSLTIEIIMQDFTKIFLHQRLFHKFIANGGAFRVLYKTNLSALCINPVSPTGHVLSSGKLIDRLKERLNINVYDVMRI